MESLGKALHARQGFGLYANISREPAKVFGPRDRVRAERGCEKYLLGVPQPPLSTLVSVSAAPKETSPCGVSSLSCKRLSDLLQTPLPAFQIITKPSLCPADRIFAPLPLSRQGLFKPTENLDSYE